MSHEKFTSRLDDYVDGTLPQAERVELETHLAACAECAATLARLRRLLESARQLPSDVAPARELWPDLRARFAAETVSLAPSHGRRHLWPLGLAAAAVVLLLAASVWYTQRGQQHVGRDMASAPAAPSRGTMDTGVMPAVVAAFERECMGAGRSLQASLEGRSAPADEALLRSVAAGIETLDRSIAETQAALAANADDTALMKLLTVRYQQKLALLQGAIAIVEEV